MFGHRLSPDNKSYSLGIKLLDSGVISKEQLNAALSMQEKLDDHDMLGDCLVKMGYITEKILAEALSHINEIDNLNIKSAILDSQLICKIPKEFALSQMVIPIAAVENQLYVATPKDQDFPMEIVDQINSYLSTQYSVIRIFAEQEDIANAITVYYDYETTIFGIIDEIESGGDAVYDDPSSPSNAIVRLVNAILLEAVKCGASDIHLEPEKSTVRLRYRIDGYLRQTCSFSSDYWVQITTRLKILADIDALESETSQSGQILCNITGKQQDLRFSSQSTIFGENIVLHLFHKEKLFLPFVELGLGKHNEVLIKKSLMKPNGIIIISGPSGAGKTTTAYSLLNQIATSEVKVLSLESPVEFDLPLVRQSDLINLRTKLPTEEIINSVLKQDPDIIFVGEIRDLDITKETFRAAMTGHKVITTFNANNALSAVLRLIDMGISPFLLLSCTRCITAQYLLRKLCNHCKIVDMSSLQEAKILGFQSNVEIYRRNGCANCQYSGYQGRTAICEVMQFGDEINALLKSANMTNEILHRLDQITFASLLKEARSKVLEGLSDIDEMIKVVDVTKFIDHPILAKE